MRVNQSSPTSVGRPPMGSSRFRFVIIGSSGCWLRHCLQDGYCIAYAETMLLVHAHVLTRVGDARRRRSHASLGTPSRRPSAIPHPALGEMLRLSEAAEEALRVLAELEPAFSRKPC